MKIFISLIFSLSAISANFIDNPNFDSPVGNPHWYKGPRSDNKNCAASHEANPICTWHFIEKPFGGRDFVKNVRYKEHVKDVVIYDQFIEYSYGNPRAQSTHFTGNFEVQPGTFEYKMCQVETKLPLYFAVEVGHRQDHPVLVDIILEEVIYSTNPRKGYNPLAENRQLSRKVVEINDNTGWHLIMSDYPSYKRDDCSVLVLRVIFPRSSEGVQLNYAQVGVDPKSLGGRGARAKNFDGSDL